MTETADVVVVGGGVNGVSIAYALAARGVGRVVLGIDGLCLATAFSGSGFKIVPAIGVCMAELIADGPAKTVDIDAFALRRFADGKSPEGPYPYAIRRDHLER